MATRKQKHAAAMQKREEWLAGEKLLGKLFQEKGRQERELGAKRVQEIIKNANPHNNSFGREVTVGEFLNVAAASQQASTAMYQLSQAFASFHEAFMDGVRHA